MPAEKKFSLEDIKSNPQIYFDNIRSGGYISNDGEYTILDLVPFLGQYSRPEDLLSRPAIGDPRSLSTFKSSLTPKLSIDSLAILLELRGIR